MISFRKLDNLVMVIGCLYKLKKFIKNPQGIKNYIVIYSKFGEGVRLVLISNCSLEHIINIKQNMQN